MTIKKKSSSELNKVEKQKSEEDNTLFGCLIGNSNFCNYLKLQVCAKNTKNKSAFYNKAVGSEVDIKAENKFSKNTMSSEPNETDDEGKVINATHGKKQSKHSTKLKKNKRKFCFGNRDNSHTRLNNKRLFRKGDELSKNCLLYTSRCV